MRRLRNLHPAWIAAAIAAAVAIWMASGQLGQQPPTEPQTSQAAPEPGRVSVQVRDSEAEPVMREARLSGRTAPVRAVTVRARTQGRVTEIAAERGAPVSEGEVIVRLDPDDRRSQLAEARATLEQRRLQFQAAESMQAKGYQTEVDLAQARANLDAARAAVERVRADIDHTTIRAPFDGVLDTRPVEVGDVLAVGDTVGRVIQQDPFIVYGNAPEDVVPYLEEGQPGSAELISGNTREGQVRYIASEADEATRTFRVELKIDNPDGRLIAGASAELRLPLEEVSAHSVEPAILTLDEDGVFGVKSVTDDGTVRFHAADIVRNRDGRVWLSGLPDRLRLITVGQGFVRAGDAVDTNADGDETVPVPAAAAETESPAP